MKHFKLILLAVILTFTATLAATEFSVKKIHHYAAYVRITPEVRDYIRGLPPEAITQIVDQLDFNKDGRGKNTFFFSFTCMKAKELQSKGIEFDEDYVFGKLTSFVRSAIKKGHVRKGSGAMNSLSEFDHPEVLKLAKELSQSEDELTRSNAELLLRKHEQRVKSRQARGNRGERGRLDDVPRKPETNPVTNPSEQDVVDVTDEQMSWQKWPVILAAIISLGALVAWLKAKSRV